MEIYLGEAAWCPIALEDLASTTALLKVGIATIFDPYSNRQKYLNLCVGQVRSHTIGGNPAETRRGGES